MSRPVTDRLRELEADVRDLPVLPAAAVRARGRRRGRRQMAAVVAAGVAVAAITVVVWPRQVAAPIADRPAVTCVLRLPDDPGDVHVRVLDGGAPAELPSTVAAQLSARRFAVQVGPDDAEPTGGVAAVRYGPAAIGAAAVVRAEVHGQVVMTFDPGRRDDTIDVTVGPAFTRLATATEVNQGLALAGEPSAPAGCTAVRR
jgi:hypothetical protein